jgi:octaprenyl-diphosphate synthase
MQLMNCNDPTTSEDSYLQVIYCKTAKLFEAATHCTAILASQSASVAEALRDYGKFLGTAFQLMDDVMDYSSDSAVMGKNVGDDLSEGKPTLPLIYAMAHANPEQRQRIHQAITERDGMEHLDEILGILAQTHALEYTVQRAEEEAQKAIAAIAFLPDSTYKTALESLARLASQRNA